MSAPSIKDLPRWIDLALIPILNVLLALIISGLVILAIGENPFEAVKWILFGAFGYAEGFGYTLYYTTSLIFTGLAVAVAFHAGLFNIGGEGQAYIGGLGIGLSMLVFDGILPTPLMIPVGILGAATFGAFWALIPAYLQAYRGSHIVITTIMFNYIAASLMVYLLVNILKKDGTMNPETRMFAEAGILAPMHEFLGQYGIEIAASPLNTSFFWALACCVLVYLYVWRSKWGYELRVVGSNERAAVYAGINPKKVIIVAMCISGALAGFLGVNELMGVQNRVVLNFPQQLGFTGIAVALMGRNHPFGIVLASLLFGVLFQGGSELAFEIPTITREMVVVIQGLIILFCGALTYLLAPTVARAYIGLAPKKKVDDKAEVA